MGLVAVKVTERLKLKDPLSIRTWKFIGYIYYHNFSGLSLDLSQTSNANPVCIDTAKSSYLPAQGGHIQPPYRERSLTRANPQLSLTTDCVKALPGRVLTT